MVKSIREAIEHAERKKGNTQAVAEVLETQREVIVAAKSGRRGLPTYQLVKLADLIGEDARELLALDALDREKDNARREVMRRIFFSVAGLGVLVLFCLTMTAREAQARTLSSEVSAPDRRNIGALFSSLAKMARRGFCALATTIHAGILRGTKRSLPLAEW